MYVNCLAHLGVIYVKKKKNNSFEKKGCSELYLSKCFSLKLRHYEVAMLIKLLTMAKKKKKKISTEPKYLPNKLTFWRNVHFWRPPGGPWLFLPTPFYWIMGSFVCRTSESLSYASVAAERRSRVATFAGSLTGTGYGWFHWWRTAGRSELLYHHTRAAISAASVSLQTGTHRAGAGAPMVLMVMVLLVAGACETSDTT